MAKKRSEYKYAVTFNDNYYQVGDTDLCTINNVGDNLKSLIKRVIAGDPNFPLVYREGKVLNRFDQLCDASVGAFYEANPTFPEDGEYPVAVLFMQ